MTKIMPQWNRFIVGFPPESVRRPPGYVRFSAVDIITSLRIAAASGAGDQVNADEYQSFRQS